MNLKFPVTVSAADFAGTTVTGMAGVGLTLDLGKGARV